MASKRLSIQQRKDIFKTLVETQDLGVMPVPESIRHVAQQFGVTESQVRQVQEEGIEKEWPPLDEDEVPEAVGPDAEE
jgi:hypothetical protein